MLKDQKWNSVGKGKIDILNDHSSMSIKGIEKIINCSDCYEKLIKKSKWMW